MKLIKRIVIVVEYLFPHSFNTFVINNDEQAQETINKLNFTSIKSIRIERYLRNGRKYK